MGFATILTGKPWLADEVVSNVLGKAFEQWERISAADNPHAYVRRMVVNEYMDWRRRLRFLHPTADPLDHDQPVASVEAAHAERDEMRARLAALPRKQHIALVLRYYVGLPDAEIAAHLGCREVTVRAHVSRALRTLRIAAADTDSVGSPGQSPRRRRGTDADPSSMSLAELFPTSEAVAE